jgi:tRNA A37 threonylcarbamoyladenosine synthetase subunit TsaC/SUA5/YrdC
MVVRAPAPLAALVRSTTDTVGFRVPDDELLLGLLQVSGPLAVSSANDHGDAPCETPERVLANFAGREGFAGVLDDGERRGVVSTVLDISGPTCQVLREGAVALEALMEYLV